MDFDNCGTIFFYQIATKGILSYSASAFNRAFQKNWIEIIPIIVLIKTSALRLFLETRGRCMVKFDKISKTLITEKTSLHHKFCIDSLWPDNTPSLLRAKMLCCDCINATIKDSRKEFSDVKLIELGFLREIRICIISCAIFQYKGETNVKMNSWNEEKIHIILKNCPFFRRHFDLKTILKINTDDLPELYIELKREIRFNIQIPQLLVEDKSFRKFITTSGELETLKKKCYKAKQNFEAINSSDVDFENGFKLMFEMFDNLNDKYVTDNLYGPFTKSFNDNKKEKFNGRYLEFREDLLKIPANEQQDEDISRF